VGHLHFDHEQGTAVLRRGPHAGGSLDADAPAPGFRSLAEVADDEFALGSP
jgi:hypothetical protein